MSSIYISIYSNGDVWVRNHAGDIVNLPGKTESGTLVKTFKINPNCSLQKITTLSGTVSSSLAATGGATTSVSTQNELT